MFNLKSSDFLKKLKRGVDDMMWIKRASDKSYDDDDTHIPKDNFVRFPDFYEQRFDDRSKFVKHESLNQDIDYTEEDLHNVKLIVEKFCYIGTIIELKEELHAEKERQIKNYMKILKTWKMELMQGIKVRKYKYRMSTDIEFYNEEKRKKVRRYFKSEINYFIDKSIKFEIFYNAKEENRSGYIDYVKRHHHATYGLTKFYEENPIIVKSTFIKHSDTIIKCVFSDDFLNQRVKRFSSKWYTLSICQGIVKKPISRTIYLTNRVKAERTLIIYNFSYVESIIMNYPNEESLNWINCGNNNNDLLCERARYIENKYTDFAKQHIGEEVDNMTIVAWIATEECNDEITISLLIEFFKNKINYDFDKAYDLLNINRNLIGSLDEGVRRIYHKKSILNNSKKPLIIKRDLSPIKRISTKNLYIDRKFEYKIPNEDLKFLTNFVKTYPKDQMDQFIKILKTCKENFMKIEDIVQAIKTYIADEKVFVSLTRFKKLFEEI